MTYDVMQPLLGWRAWTGYPDIEAIHFGAPLLSLGWVADGQDPGQPTLWRWERDHAGATTAACRYHPDHEAPVSDCECGLYGCNRLSDVKPHYSYSKAGGQTLWLIGAVKGWGRIEVYKDGFRAEYARPVGFVSYTDAEWNLLLNPRYRGMRSQRQDVDRYRRYANAYARALGLPLWPSARAEDAASKLGASYDGPLEVPTCP